MSEHQKVNINQNKYFFTDDVLFGFKHLFWHKFLKQCSLPTLLLGLMYQKSVVLKIIEYLINLSTQIGSFIETFKDINRPVELIIIICKNNMDILEVTSQKVS